MLLPLAAFCRGLGGYFCVWEFFDNKISRNIRISVFPHGHVYDCKRNI